MSRLSISGSQVRSLRVASNVLDGRPRYVAEADVRISQGVCPQVCPCGAHHHTPSEARTTRRKSSRFAPGMVWDGVAHTTAAPFKQRVTGSIPVRLTRIRRQLRDLPAASHCRLPLVVTGAGSGAGCASQIGTRQTLNGVELVGRREVRIALSHRQRLVTHQLLHRSDIDPAHHKPRREGVPQVVPPEVSDASPL